MERSDTHQFQLANVGFGKALNPTRWFGEKIDHADIAVACALRFTREAHPQLFDAARCPALSAHTARCEALPVFCEIVQPLNPPSRD
jgi:glutathione S-transferase